LLRINNKNNKNKKRPTTAQFGMLITYLKDSSFPNFGKGDDNVDIGDLTQFYKKAKVSEYVVTGDFAVFIHSMSVTFILHFSCLTDIHQSYLIKDAI
jgi:hypothetical protein